VRAIPKPERRVDDAEELARRGLDVTAFDIAPTAIQWCRRRFPQSRVHYQVADLLNPPLEWTGAFDLVLESYTLQVLPPTLRGRAMQSLAGCLAERGRLLLICRGREPQEEPAAHPAGTYVSCGTGGARGAEFRGLP